MNSNHIHNGTAKKILSVVAAVGLLASVAACGSANSSEDVTVVKVALTTSSDEPIWEQVNKNLKNAGEKIKVEPVAMKSAVLGNQALVAGDVDLSAQQHYAFLNGEIKTKGYEISAIAETYLSPLNIYSNKLKSIKGLKKGDKILIPNDVTNGGRALTVLQAAGVIKLNPDKVDPANGVYPAQEDITDAAAGIANANAVVDFGRSVNDNIFAVDLNPKSAINKPWINVIVARSKDKDSEVYRKIIKAYHTDSVKKVIKDTLDGSVLPVW